MLEVHQALGTDYRTIASCKLRFREIFDRPHGRVHGVADVISMSHVLSMVELCFLVYYRVVFSCIL